MKAYVFVLIVVLLFCGLWVSAMSSTRTTFDSHWTSVGK